MNKKWIYVFGASVVLIVVVIYLFLAQTTSKSATNLTVRVRSEKSEYVLGEIMSLNIEIQNLSGENLLLAGSSVESGYLQILISRDGGDFKKYSNPSWGNKKTKARAIKPLESAQSTATILSNSIPDLNGLSDVAIRSFEDKQVMTVYAFPKAGKYYLKAVLIVPDKNGNKEIESEPIQITLNEPQGQDLEIWNKIKDRADFAYFMQNGEMVNFKDFDEQTKFQAEVEEIINQYPNSFYAQSLRQSLTKFQVNEAKRKAYLDKLNKPN